MSLAEEMLATMPLSDDSATYSADEEPHIVINESRQAIVPDELKTIAVTGDKDIETVTFDCVRYWDGHDLSTFAIYLNYVLPDLSVGTYIPESIVADGNVFHFDWNIKNNITKKNGKISFAITAIKAKQNESGETVVDKQWSSLPNSDCSIALGLDISNVPSEEESSDVLAQMSDILGQIQEDFDEWLKNNLLISQTIGESETAVMSQKAVTECVRKGVSSVDLSNRVVGYYIKYDGTLMPLQNTFYTQPISLRKGEKIKFGIMSYKVMGMLSYIQDGVYTPLMVGHDTDYNNLYEYEYTAETDIDVVLSGYEHEATYIKIIDTRIENKLDKMSEIDINNADVGKYINFRGEVLPFAESVTLKPLSVKKGEIIKINARCYKTFALISEYKYGVYTPLMVGHDTDYENFYNYEYKVTRDCDVCLSAYEFREVSITNYRDFYNTTENVFDNIVVGGGLASCYDTMGFIGDSISSGECYSNENGTNDAHDIYAVSWGQYLAKACNSTGFNYSRGGQTTKTWLQEWSNHETFVNNPCKMYVIGLGQNDGYDTSASRSVPLGSITDIGTDNETFYGLYAKIINRIKEIQPKAHIFILTNPLDEVENNGYNEAIRYMERVFENVFLLDYYVNFRHLLGNGIMGVAQRLGHFTAIGYRLMADYMATYIDWYMKRYPEKFTQIEFIGTNWEWTN